MIIFIWEEKIDTDILLKWMHQTGFKKNIEISIFKIYKKFSTTSLGGGGGRYCFLATDSL